WRSSDGEISDRGSGGSSEHKEQRCREIFGEEKVGADSVMIEKKKRKKMNLRKGLT
ncbi:hypothetical protein PIB30_047667, partial [Stylosanthes scabra]|nr:hypothetical protein [Stylosanthes scabra]